MKFLSAKPADLGRNVLLVFPLLAAIAFVQAFARALPLTDEWFYVHTIRQLHDVNPLSFSGITEAIHLYPVRFNEHLVGFPFLLYWPIAEWSNFDSRWIIYLTVAAFAGQALIFRRYLVPSSWAVLPIGLLLFSPSHFMEFLWGWQITLSFSVVFPLAGLAAINQISKTDGWLSQVRSLAIGVGCILLGTFSSAGGFFGFAAAVVLVGLKPLGWRTKTASTAVLLVIGGLIYWSFMRATPTHLTTGWREFWYVLTAQGAALWGSPVGMFKFGFDPRSAAGLAMAILTIAVIVRAIVLRVLPQLALALSVTLFGYLCVAPIAMSRPYLGNWHVQYALPAVCGAYAAAYGLRKVDRSIFSAVPFFGLCALLLSGLFGYYKGFTDYGPDYLRYVRSIENHVIRNLEEPGQRPPYPPQGTRDMDAQLTLFLSAHRHPLFAGLPPPSKVSPLPLTARVFVDETEASPPRRISGDRGKVGLLTVIVPGPALARGVLAKIGGTTLILRRVHPQYTPAASGRDPAAVYFMGALVPHLLPTGELPVEFSIFE